MARPELGSKRQCSNCGAKFYDLSKDPPVCPQCGTVFQMAMAGSTRVAAPAVARASATAPEEEAETETGDVETVSLDDVEAEENAGAETPDEEAAEGASDEFLEEEEEGGDVADLIDNDIESDEET